MAYNFKNLGDMFREGIYEVPEYQRNYAWEQQQLKDLWEDLESLDLETPYKHYTGTVVAEKGKEISKYGKSFAQFKIIDGQQRLATLAILLFCIYERLKNLSDKEAEKTADNILEYIKDESTDVFKLKLNGGDDDFLKDVILKSPEREMAGREPATHSEMRLKKAKEFFRGKLKDKDFNYLSKLIEKITIRLLFIRYEVANEVEAGLVFEVMNDRGIDLKQVDKIKNYLIYISYRKGDKDLAKSIHEAWGEIFRNLMGIDKFDEDDLLRYHWVMYNGEYKTEKLSDIHRRLKEEEGFNLHRREILSTIKEYVRSLKETSYVFKELNNPENYFSDWQGLGDSLDEINGYINGLHKVRTIAPFMPLLIASRIVWKDSPEKFKEIVKLCEYFAFRIYKLNNRRSDTGQSTLYRLAHGAFEKRKSDENKKQQVYTNILDNLKWYLGEYGDDEELKNNLSREDLCDNWLERYEIKYLLYELEKKKCKDKKESPAQWQDINKNATVEHIWPQTPRGYEGWTDKQKKIHEKYVNRLGNLTLTFWNPELSNKDFSEKKELYKGSNIAIQRELASFDSWGENEIDERTKKIIQFVLERWKIEK